MERETFEELVRQAVATLPEEIAERMSNVDVEVQERPTEQQLRSLGVPSGQTLLGLYQGIPLTRRTSGYNLVSPDRITIFQRPLELTSRGDDDLVERVRETVIHEIAHHFGISDERLQEMERERNKRKR
ncbi:MAG: metallopeptidase family protein [Chloroflexi bacterium]|nr:metallopeptidase family protein [Chloroflexota bacterium]